MKKKMLFMLILVCVNVYAFPQIKATTQDNREVLLNENGSWVYAEEPTEKSDPMDLQCEDLITKEMDKVTGELTISAKDPLIISNKDDDKLNIIFVKGDRDVIIVGIQAIGASRCIDDDDKINILFRDGTRLELRNNGKFNCDAMNTQYFGGLFGKKKELTMLREKEIETMRVWTSDGYVEEDFTLEQSTKFRLIMDCLASN
jgi:hypothetical protein